MTLIVPIKLDHLVSQCALYKNETYQDAKRFDRRYKNPDGIRSIRVSVALLFSRHDISIKYSITTR
jgi:hypothetical protein